MRAERIEDICPDCGGPKAPKARRCKPCLHLRNWGTPTPVPEPKPKPKPKQDGLESHFPYEVVNGDDFRDILTRYETEWLASRPNHEKTSLGAFSVIQENTGVSKDTLGAVRRTDSRKREWISARTADVILTEIGLSHLLDDGTLAIVPNRHISQERYSEWRRERGCYD